MPIDSVLRLARGWYTDPRVEAWRPRTRDESQRVLTDAGFVGDFWQLPEDALRRRLGFGLSPLL